MSRVPFLLFLALAHVSALFLMAYAPIVWLRNWIPLASVLVGIGYGGMFTLVPTVVSVVWGINGFGRNWGFLTFAPGSFPSFMLPTIQRILIFFVLALGAVIFGLFYARVYDLHSPPPPAICEGRECWRDAFLAAAWTGLIATVLLGCIWWMGWRKRGWIV